MKAVAFNGSPRKNGNTQYLLRKVLEPIAAAGIETELVQVGGKPVRGCTACGKCFENKDQRCRTCRTWGGRLRGLWGSWGELATRCAGIANRYWAGIQCRALRALSGVVEQCPANAVAEPLRREQGQIDSAGGYV